ncbi:MAG: signal peptidase II [Deltaproteobacteria bacterium]|nr:signal peptidase II [Deltaproteobacteria bacterium]
MSWGPGCNGAHRPLKNKRNLFFIWPAGVVVFLDQLSKLVILATFEFHESFPVVHDFFNLVLVRNRGMAFGIMNRHQGRFVFYFLILLTIAAIAILIYWAGRQAKEKGRVLFGLGLILGGAVGNLIDRVRLGFVIDFLDFFAGRYHWPAFNLADSAITIGTIWVAIHLIRQGIHRG